MPLMIYCCKSSPQGRIAGESGDLHRPHWPKVCAQRVLEGTQMERMVDGRLNGGTFDRECDGVFSNTTDE